MLMSRVADPCSLLSSMLASIPFFVLAISNEAHVGVVIVYGLSVYHRRQATLAEQDCTWYWHQGCELIVGSRGSKVWPYSSRKFWVWARLTGVQLQRLLNNASASLKENWAKIQGARVDKVTNDQQKLRQSAAVLAGEAHTFAEFQ